MTMRVMRSSSHQLDLIESAGTENKWENTNWLKWKIHRIFTLNWRIYDLNFQQKYQQQQ